MPAKSKAQQRFMGMVHGLQKGTVDPSKVSGKVKKVAKDMKEKDAEDYASTKHKGKPEHVKEEALKKLIRKEIASIFSEKVAMQHGEHLQKAQKEIAYMIGEGPLENEDVYDKPIQSIKFLKIAQNALNRVK